MLLAIAGVLVAVAVVTMIPVLMDPPSMRKLKVTLQRIESGDYTEAEHITSLRQAVKEQKLAFVSHAAMLGVQVCFALAWHDPWWITLVYLGLVGMQILILRRLVDRRRFFQGRLQEYEDEVVGRAKVDEEAERILRNEG